MRALYAAFALLASPALAECDAEGHCEIAEGTYHIAVPEGVEAPPMVLWLHGAGGSGAAALRNGGSVQRYLDRGYAFAAADGLPRNADSRGGSWSFHPDWPQRRDEVAFFAAIIADAAQVHGVDPDRVILAGFSIGGSMTHYTACAQPDLFDAYAPVAGAFWRPHPVECVGPVDLFHTHGWNDATVPLEGRTFRPGTILEGGVAQGDSWYAMILWRDANGCATDLPNVRGIDGDLWTREWTECAQGTLRFDLHPGGHGIPQGWSGRMLDWYEALPGG